MAKKNKAKFVVRQCGGSYAVFKASSVRRFESIVPLTNGIPDVEPFRGYTDMSKPMAECVAERLTKELK